MNARAPASREPVAPQRAWIVFCGETERWWLRLLRPGFRHCFALLHDGGRWLLFDPLAPHLELSCLPLPSGYDAPGWYARQPDMRVVPARLRRDTRRPAPLGPFTCVEAVKRLLGIHARLIVTPWQLFRYLTRPARNA